MKIPFHWYAWCAAEDWQHCHSGIQSNVSTLVLIRVLFFLTSFLYINDISLNRPCIIYIHNNRKKMFFSLIEPPRLSLMFTFLHVFSVQLQSYDDRDLKHNADAVTSKMNLDCVLVSVHRSDTSSSGVNPSVSSLFQPSCYYPAGDDLVKPTCARYQKRSP